MLVHHPDPELQRGEGTADIDLLPLEEYLAGLRQFLAEEYLHQGAFSGAVFPYQTVDIPLSDGEVDIFVGYKAVLIDLSDVLH